jgi:hypothetical protein
MDVGPVLALLDRERRAEHHFVTTIVNSAMRFFRGWDVSHTYYDYNTPSRFETLTAAVAEHDQGWILLDRWRNGVWLPGIPTRDQTIGGKAVTFLGLYGDIHVYRWGRAE